MNGGASWAELPVPVDDPGTVRSEADRLVEGLVDGRGAVQRLLDGLHRGVSDFLGDLLGGVGAGTGAAGLLVQVLVIGAAVAVIALAMRALLRARRERVTGPHGEGVHVVLGEAVTPDALDEQILRAEADGDWAAAVMARFRLLVADLISRRVLSDIVGRTTGEYRVEFGEIRPAGADEFAAASRLFERAYYGREAMSADDAAAMVQWTLMAVEPKEGAR